MVVTLIPNVASEEEYLTFIPGKRRTHHRAKKTAKQAEEYKESPDKR